MSRISDIMQYPHWRVTAIGFGGEVVHSSVHATESSAKADAGAARSRAGVRDVTMHLEPAKR